MKVKKEDIIYQISESQDKYMYLYVDEKTMQPTLNLIEKLKLVKVTSFELKDKQYFFKINVAKAKAILGV